MPYIIYRHTKKKKNYNVRLNKTYIHMLSTVPIYEEKKTLFELS